VHGPSSVGTSAYFRPAAIVHGVQSNQFTTDATLTDVGYGRILMSSAFMSSTTSQALDVAPNVDRSQSTHLAHDYMYNYSPVSVTTPAVYETSRVYCTSHMPAYQYGWTNAAVPVSSGPRSNHIPFTSWQNIRQQTDVESPATAGTRYSAAVPITLQTSMQFSPVSTITSPAASIPSPVISPYSPSVGKTYYDSSDSEGPRLPSHLQSQYIENLLQLHCLLLASNKLQAARYPSPSLAARRFDTYIPGSVAASTSRLPTFDVNHLSLLPGGYQHAFTAPRFPRFALESCSVMMTPGCDTCLRCYHCCCDSLVVNLHPSGVSCAKDRCAKFSPCSCSCFLHFT